MTIKRSQLGKQKSVYEFRLELQYSFLFKRMSLVPVIHSEEVWVGGWVGGGVSHFITSLYSLREVNFALSSC